MKLIFNNMQLVKRDSDYFLLGHRKPRLNDWILCADDSIQRVKSLNTLLATDMPILATSQAGLFLPNIYIPQLIDLIDNSNPWQIGNKLKITTIYDFENEGKKVYEGEVIKYKEGLGFYITDKGITYGTQGTYWFGSILNQDIKVVSRNLNRDYSFDDLKQGMRLALLCQQHNNDTPLNIDNIINECIGIITTEITWTVEVQTVFKNAYCEDCNTGCNNINTVKCDNDDCENIEVFVDENNFVNILKIK